MSQTDNPAAPSKRSGRITKKKAASSADIQSEILRRVPPHSPDAETAVLCGLLTRPELIGSIADILRSEDFYLPANQIIYRAFLDLYAKGTPIDLVTSAELLRSRNEIESIGGSVYLAQLSQAVVMGANAEYYAEIVRAKATLRQLIEVCSKVITSCYDESEDVNELLDESEQDILSISRHSTKHDFSKTPELLEKVFENLTKLSSSKDAITGITTGFEQLDLLTSGLQKSNLVIVGARPSIGKTSFSLCMALNAAIKQNARVAFFSLEMSREEIMKRMLAVLAKVDLKHLTRPSLLTPAEWQDLHQAADRIAETKFFIDDTPALTTMELRARARRLKAEQNLDLIVIDYLQLMRSSRRTDSRELEISDISRSLKALAKELDLPVIALSQLNRKLEDRTDKRPILADLRESGAIEQDADVIMFVHREDVYKSKKMSERPVESEAEIIIGKQRNGPVGVAELIYKSPYTSFENRSWTPPTESIT